MPINDMPKENAGRWAWIKYQLERQGYTLVALAVECGVGPDCFSLVKNRHYPKIQKIIADKLILLPQEIWPERYGNDGQPIKHSPRYPRKGIKRQSKRQRLTNKAV